MTEIYVPSEGKKDVIGTEEHQVFTLEAKQEWRMIRCKHRHLLADPEKKGICMNGVVYYIAKISDELSKSLISFNLRSEDFNVIKFPKDVKYLWSCYLVNYNGKIALTNDSCNDGTLDLWVMKDASKQEWSKASLLVPCWTNLVGDQRFRFKGTFSTGELIFAPCTFPNPYFEYYDLKGKNARKLVIEGIGDDLVSFKVFMDHVESPMFLPKVCLSDND